VHTTFAARLAGGEQAVVDVGGVLLGPPPLQRGTRPGTGVMQQVDEELVDAQQVIAGGAAGQPQEPFPAGAWRFEPGPVRKMVNRC